MNVNLISFAIFVLFIAVFLYFKRMRIQIQKIAYPFFYLILYRTKLGLKLINKWGSKYSEFFRFFGLIAIGLGFFYMAVAVYNIGASYYLLIKYLFKPVFPLLVPGVNIPGEGIVSFPAWIIAIFVIATVHEFAHGVVAIANKVNIKNTGFGFLSFIVPIFPAFFVEPDEEKMRKESDVVQYSILSAGSISNLLVYLVLILVITFAMNPVRAMYSEPVGVSMESINDNYPAGKLLEGRVTVSGVNNISTLTSSDFTKSLSGLKPGDEVVFHLANGTSYTLVAAADPDNGEKGYLGVFGFKDEVKWENNAFGAAFDWLLSLFRLVALLNMIVALVNLMPLFITDGSRMIQVLFERLFKNIKKAKAYWLLVNAIVSLLVIGSLLLPYALKWFN
ncbi:site-2 protease family protein [Candidatus Woesearchaeota archaeon]|nr:site-2 protease family protein [Candidatus Woesearchaeota archaeon]